MTKKKAVLIPLLITLALILGLSFVVYWQFKNFQESLAKASLPKFKIPENNSNFWFLEGGNYKEWTSPDGKLKIQYPNNWLEMEEGSFKDFFLQSTEEKKILLFAYRFNLKNLRALNFLVIGRLEMEKNLEEIIEQMKKDAEATNGEMKVLNLNIGQKEAEFETEYETSNGNLFHSKEKLLLDKEDVYWVGIFSQKNDWSKIENEAKTIIDSVTLTPEMIE